MFVQTTTSINLSGYVGGAGALGVLWRDQTNNRWCWYNAKLSKWVISQNVGYKLVSKSPSPYTGYVFTSDTRTFNGNICYRHAASGRWVWHDNAGWKLTLNDCLGFGDGELQHADLTYYGDDWYLSSTLAGTFAARGYYRSNPTPPSWAFDELMVNSTAYWLKDGSAQTTPFGSYSPQGSASGVLTVGLLQMKDGTNKTYLQASANDITKGFGDISYVSANKWTIGVPDSETGWFEYNGNYTSFPRYSSTSPITFVNTKTNTGTYVMVGGNKAPDIVVSFDSLTQGVNTAKYLICEAVRWVAPLI